MDPPTGAVKLTSTVGGRNPAHATGAGKLLLSHLLITPEQVADWVREAPLVRRTPATLTGAEELHAELSATRRRGYGIDDQENEPGVNCIALPVYLTTPNHPSGAISVSGLTYRMPIRELTDRVEEMRAILGPLGAPMP
ncbi:MAG TPA: IclR family transcriptional regulator C-terminal domain-containing protein [Actinomycetaceae bacterium]|nr:IclR family transcriptional regulator C-terminal domain-containing protein [Actinomycetaceae bacterium]